MNNLAPKPFETTIVLVGSEEADFSIWRDSSFLIKSLFPAFIKFILLINN